MEYCINCWSNQTTNEINSTLFKPFIYCNNCWWIFETIYREIMASDFDEYSDTTRIDRVLSLWKATYIKENLSIKDLEKLWLM